MQKIESFCKSVMYIAISLGTLYTSLAMHQALESWKQLTARISSAFSEGRVTIAFEPKLQLPDGTTTSSSDLPSSLLKLLPIPGLSRSPAPKAPTPNPTPTQN